jgi:hypothetical protein
MSKRYSTIPSEVGRSLAGIASGIERVIRKTDFATLPAGRTVIDTQNL